jgi:hypothetical protein
VLTSARRAGLTPFHGALDQRLCSMIGDELALNTRAAKWANARRIDVSDLLWRRV